MPSSSASGAVTNFFDTLGHRLVRHDHGDLPRCARWCPDRLIPGTLNVGHTIPTVAQAFIYTSVIPVDVLTLFSMIAAAVLGAWLGAGVVAGWPKQKVQFGMGAALLVAATLMLITQVQVMTGSRILPLGGDALGVRGTLLVVAVAGNFLLGALMTLGIGLYAPCMILVSLLGMNPTAAFPIMMGSCAFLMPVGSLRFIRERAYSLRNALGLAIGGLPGVLIAAYIVKSLEPRHGPLAGDRRRALHGHHDAAIGLERKGVSVEERASVGDVLGAHRRWSMAEAQLVSSRRASLGERLVQ